MKRQEMERLLISQYGENDAAISVFNAPGRVNLIGEHIDYNGGYVLPAALEFGTTMAIRKRTDRKVMFSSTNLTYKGEFDVDQLGSVKTGEWVDYPIGVIVELGKLGVQLSSGYDILFQGEIPNGAGLSSSASIEVVTAYGLLVMENQPADKVEIAKLSQRAENHYVGVNSGIMDQFAVANGAKDHAILLMCDTLEYQLVPFVTGNYKLVISNTNKRRGLVDSKYNERRGECDAALKILQQDVPGLEYLAHLPLEQFAQLKGKFTDEVLLRRATHVIEENARVLQSALALRANDLVRFGQLMNASHDSLRDLYEVSCMELDVMVEEARNIEGTLGSRMTGAGFGGCTVSLVHEDAIDQFLSAVGEAYEKRTGLKGEFYVCGVGNGVQEMKEEY